MRKIQDGLELGGILAKSVRQNLAAAYGVRRDIAKMAGDLEQIEDLRQVFGGLYYLWEEELNYSLTAIILQYNMMETVAKHEKASHDASLLERLQAMVPDLNERYPELVAGYGLYRAAVEQGAGAEELARVSELDFIKAHQVIHQGWTLWLELLAAQGQSPEPKDPEENWAAYCGRYFPAKASKEALPSMGEFARRAQDLLMERVQEEEERGPLN